MTHGCSVLLLRFVGLAGPQPYLKDRCPNCGSCSFRGTNAGVAALLVLLQPLVYSLVVMGKVTRDRYAPLVAVGLTG